MATNVQVRLFGFLVGGLPFRLASSSLAPPLGLSPPLWSVNKRSVVPGSSVCNGAEAFAKHIVNEANARFGDSFCDRMLDTQVVRY